MFRKLPESLLVIALVAACDPDEKASYSPFLMPETKPEQHYLITSFAPR